MIGIAWGGAIARVEVSIDSGAWHRANLVTAGPHGGPTQGLAWKFWTYDWGHVPSGRHTVTSRATGADGAIQPSPDDPVIADRRTYWEANQHITRTILYSRRRLTPGVGGGAQRGTSCRACAPPLLSSRSRAGHESVCHRGADHGGRGGLAADVDGHLRVVQSRVPERHPRCRPRRRRGASAGGG